MEISQEKADLFVNGRKKEMSRIKVTKKLSSKKAEKQKDWPVVVYMWAVGLGIVGYLVVGEAVFESRPHPIHWLAGLVGVAFGVGVGWLWYRWRGDVL